MPDIAASARTRLAQLHGTLTATPPRRRAFRIFSVLFALWLLFCLFAWLAGPTLLVNAATGYVEKEFGHRLQIRELRINPLKLALTVEGLALGDNDGRDIVGFRTMVVDVDVTSAFRAMAILDEFRLDGLTLNIERLDADRFNFSELADRLAARFAAQPPAAGEQSATTAATAAAEPAKEGAAVYFLIRHLDLSDAALRFADHTRTPVYESWMRPLNLRMDDLTSRPDREAPYNISATLGTGGTVAWEGDLTLEPLRSKGAVTLSGFGLSAAYDYVKDSFGFALPQGTLDARIDYFADFSGKQSVLRIDDGRAEVKGLALTDLAENPLFAFDSTTVSGVRADIMKATATVQRFETRGGRVNVVLDEKGVSNIERALVPRVPPVAVAAKPAAVNNATTNAVATKDASAKSGSTAGNTAPAPAWQVELKKFAILDYALAITDYSTTPDAQLRMTRVNFEADAIRLPELPAIPFTFSGVFEERGQLSARGSYTLAGGIVDADVELRELPLAPVSPYLASIGRFTLTGGTLRWQGNVKGKANMAGGMQVKGSGGLHGIAVRDDVRKTRLATLQDLAIEGVDFDDRAARLAVKAVTVAGLDVDVAVDAKGISNIQRVLTPAVPAARPPVAATATAAAPAMATVSPAKKSAGAKQAAEKPLAIRVDSIVLRDGKVSLRDDSPDLSFNAQLAGLNGRIDGLSSDPAKRAKVQLDGTFNKYAPLSVSGTINPLAAETWADVQVRIASLDLGALTPYTVTYIAYPLARGKMGLELDWKIADRKFDAKNRVVISGLALGDKQQAPRALKLPVKLGIALLTNRNGDANLDVPAYGELDDPQFRYGRVILQALGNLVTRAATAPFAALGSLGGNKPDVIEFAPGAVALAAAESEKLARLATTLADKPMLTLAIAGAASAESDRLALQQEELSLRLRRAWLDDNRKRGLTIDQVVLNDEQRLEMLADIYQQVTKQRLDALRDAAGKPLPESAQVAAAEQALLPTIAIDDGALRELARERSQKVKDALLAGGIEEARLVIVDGKVIVAGGDAVPTTLALEAR